MRTRSLPLLGAGLAIAGLLAIGAAYAAHPSNGSSRTANDPAARHGMLGRGDGYGMLGRGDGYGMMGAWSASSSAPVPGEAGFVAGTEPAPRVVQIYAYPNDRFVPDTVTVQAGETITFQVTSIGPTTHEFMVGPAADVAADKEGTPEIADIGMMQTKSITYTFSGSGPYAFACHEPGHYEAGMHGTIVVQ
jgi:plastocyanin